MREEREREMAYKYQYNPAATDNVSLHDNTRGRTAGSLTYRSTRLVLCDGNISNYLGEFTFELLNFAQYLILTMSLS